MTLPTEAATIAGIVETSPAAIGDKTSVVRLSDEIKEWQVAQSPPSATVHDTGWKPGGLAAGFTGSVSVRRIGHTVEVFFAINGTIGGGLVTVGTVPAGHRPFHNAWGSAFLPDDLAGISHVNSAGEIKIVHNGSAARSSVQGSILYFLG